MKPNYFSIHLGHEDYHNKWGLILRWKPSPFGLFEGEQTYIHYFVFLINLHNWSQVKGYLKNLFYIGRG